MMDIQLHNGDSIAISTPDDGQFSIAVSLPDGNSLHITHDEYNKHLAIYVSAGAGHKVEHKFIRGNYRSVIRFEDKERE